MILSTASGQDTLIKIEPYILRALYSDALKFDSCKVNQERYKEIVGNQDEIIRHKDSMYSYKVFVFEQCSTSLEATKSERDTLHTQLIESEVKVNNKNKWLARAGIALGIETFLLFLLLI